MCVSDLLSYIQLYFEFILDLYQSGFSWLFESNLIIAAIGAFFGAYGGQYIVENSRRKESQLEEIRSINSAISCNFTITNTLLGMRQRYYKALYDNFFAQKNKIDEIFGGKVKASFDLQVNLPPLLPSDQLMNLCTEKISLNTSVAHLVFSLLQSIQSLGECIEKRNETILHIKNGQLTDIQKLQFYFGVEDESGTLDSTHEDCVISIHNLIDDVIFFCELLTGQLSLRGNELRKAYGKEAPNIGSYDFTEAKSKGLFPNPENYPDWKKLIINPI